MRVVVVRALRKEAFAEIPGPAVCVLSALGAVRRLLSACVFVVLYGISLAIYNCRLGRLDQLLRSAV